MNYDLYLFSCLIKNHDEHFNTLPYDEQYELVPKMYEQFEKSIFNDKRSDLYTCMEQYLRDKFGTTDSKYQWDGFTY